eukprot:CAMPEP_0115076418 /NCGR_PEP_ID=MMETSP0227-20121206/16421_1 /TAXON_ID=89957 /ORGANISM="Polarella glacialis, Strain CCMP 1383" /LENGTH=102 /DNA_ID=CAMNT_0002463567 /DNA_START=133 /DNA_END=441 /DNA_ORIENTATION=+
MVLLVSTHLTTLFVLCILLGLLLLSADGGPIAAGSTVAYCYTACNAGYVTCMAASGLVSGVTGPVGWWAWLTSAAAGCSAVQAACMAACTAGGAAAAAAPTP